MGCLGKMNWSRAPTQVSFFTTDFVFSLHTFTESILSLVTCSGRFTFIESVVTEICFHALYKQNFHSCPSTLLQSVWERKRNNRKLQCSRKQAQVLCNYKTARPNCGLHSHNWNAAATANRLSALRDHESEEKREKTGYFSSGCGIPQSCSEIQTADT